MDGGDKLMNVRVPFSVLKIEELMDGRVRVEWETIADDELRLVESDIFTPDPGGDLEDQLVSWLEGKRQQRERLNALRRSDPPPVPRIKRTTRTLNEAAIQRLQDRFDPT